MQVVIKPKGIAVVLIVLVATIALIVVLLNRQATPAAAGADAKTTVGGWAVLDSGKTVRQEALGEDHREYSVPAAHAPKLSPYSGSFSVIVHADSLGKEQFSKYGIAVYAQGSTDGFSGWIDPKFKVLATAGLGNGWQNVPLPDDFDMAKDHKLTIEWADRGRAWTVSVDDSPTIRQVRTMSGENRVDHVALVSQDAAVTYILP